MALAADRRTVRDAPPRRTLAMAIVAKLNRKDGRAIWKTDH
jgi:hypothetical protein